MKENKEIIYKLGVERLRTLLTPMHQFYLPSNRQLDMDRVEKMKKLQEEAYAKNKHCPILFTMIKLGKHESFINDVNKHGIVLIDGQHRIAVVDLLLNDSPEIFIGKHLLVSVYSGKTRKEIFDYFRDVNNNWEPVPPLNLDEGVNKVVKQVGDWFIQKFDKKMFSDRSGCHRPHLYMNGELGLLGELSKNKRIRCLVDNNRDDLDIVSAHIIFIMNKYNQFLSRQNFSYFLRTLTGVKLEDERKTCYTAHKKAADMGLFLGMWSDFIWIDKVFDHDEKSQIVVKKKI